jgi:hypothetical protein
VPVTPGHEYRVELFIRVPSHPTPEGLEHLTFAVFNALVGVGLDSSVSCNFDADEIEIDSSVLAEGYTDLHEWITGLVSAALTALPVGSWLRRTCADAEHVDG